MPIHTVPISIGGDPRDPKTFALALFPFIQDVVVNIAFDSRFGIKPVADAMAEALERLAKAVRLSITEGQITQEQVAALAKQITEVLSGDPNCPPPTLAEQVISIDGKKMRLPGEAIKPFGPPAGCVAEGDERIGCAHRGYCWRPQPCQPPEDRNGL